MARTETHNFWNELTAVSLYKRNQGRLARQLTAAGIGLGIALGAYWLYDQVLLGLNPAVRVAIPALIIAIGGWATFRLINWPTFAEFLIAVEGEMNKVTWATKTELIRATIVVLVTMLFLGAILTVYDIVWAVLLRWIGVIQ